MNFTSKIFASLFAGALFATACFAAPVKGSYYECRFPDNSVRMSSDPAKGGSTRWYVVGVYPESPDSIFFVQRTRYTVVEMYLDPLESNIIGMTLDSNADGKRIFKGAYTSSKTGKYLPWEVTIEPNLDGTKKVSMKRPAKEGGESLVATDVVECKIEI